MKQLVKILIICTFFVLGCFFVLGASKFTDVDIYGLLNATNYSDYHLFSNLNITGNLSVSENLSVSDSILVTNDLDVGSGTLFVNGGGNVGIGITSPTHTLNSYGTFNITRADGTAQVYENATCAIIKGTTSTMEIC